MSSFRHFPKMQLAETSDDRKMAFVSATRSTLFVPSPWYPACHQVSISHGSQNTRSVRVAKPPSDEQSPRRDVPGFPGGAVAGNDTTEPALNSFGDPGSSTRLPSSSIAHARIVCGLPSWTGAGSVKTNP